MKREVNEIIRKTNLLFTSQQSSTIHCELMRKELRGREEG